MYVKQILHISLIALLVLIIPLAGCGVGTKESVAVGKYPVKPITVIVPFAAGGGSDMIARAMEKSSQQILGQPFVIVNKAGGAGMIGMNDVAGASPDGYTIGIVGLSAILQPIYGPTRYHYPTALEPLAQVVSMPILVVIRSDHPWKNLNDLITYAKENPGKIKFGHSGLGTAMHITGEMFAREAGITIMQVPFKGDSEALAALLGDHVQFIVATPSSIQEHVKSGAVRALGLAEEKRLTLPGFETIPTFQEQGINLAFNFWNGVAAPKGLPAAEKAKLTAAIKEMVDNPAFKKDMAEIGMIVKYQGPDEFSDQWISDNAKLTKIVKETGIANLIANQKN